MEGMDNTTPADVADASSRSNDEGDVKIRLFQALLSWVTPKEDKTILDS